ncbi:MAG: metallophosphoesterase [bacterium]
MKKTYLTSDTHFGHKLMLKFRPFNSVEEMNEVLIENWNKTVNPGDDVYHHGDVAFVSNSMIKEITKKLNGNIFLIRGNHDSFGLSDTKSRGFSWIKDYYELKYHEYRFCMFHYPQRVWHWSHKGTFHTYGHTHYTINQNYGRSMEVGMDNPECNYSPFDIDYVVEKLKNIPILVADGHLSDEEKNKGINKL